MRSFDNPTTSSFGSSHSLKSEPESSPRGGNYLRSEEEFSTQKGNFFKPERESSQRVKYVDSERVSGQKVKHVKSEQEFSFEFKHVKSEPESTQKVKCYKSVSECSPQRVKYLKAVPETSPHQIKCVKSEPGSSSQNVHHLKSEPESSPHKVKYLKSKPGSSPHKVKHLESEAELSAHGDNYLTLSESVPQGGNYLSCELKSCPRRATPEKAKDGIFPTSTRLDWIEKEMARVCGEGIGNTAVGSGELQSPFHSPCDTLDKKPILPLKRKGDKNVHIVESLHPSLKLDWRHLRQKHETELRTKLDKLEATGDLEKRRRLEKRFIELFGEEDWCNESQFEKKKMKDEIAAYTVKHLMPMYKAQRIVSKDLFKKLAKHISSCVMEKFDFPDEKCVELLVQDFFCNEKSVMSEADICS